MGESNGQPVLMVVSSPTPSQSGAASDLSKSNPRDASNKAVDCHDIVDDCAQAGNLAGRCVPATDVSSPEHGRSPTNEEEARTNINHSREASHVVW